MIWDITSIASSIIYDTLGGYIVSRPKSRSSLGTSYIVGIHDTYRDACILKPQDLRAISRGDHQDDMPCYLVEELL